MQFGYQFPERCERLVLVSTGGLGRELHAMLRAAALPGAGVVLPWLSVAGRHASADGPRHGEVGPAGERRPRGDVAQLRRARGARGPPGFPANGERSHRPGRPARQRHRPALPDRRPSDADRLGRADPLIPVRHAHEAHERIGGAGSRSSRAPATSRTATFRSASPRPCSTSSRRRRPFPPTRSACAAGCAPARSRSPWSGLIVLSGEGQFKT